MSTEKEDATANSRQVGGDHYRKHGRADLQHWDVVHMFNLDYFQGNITKYVFRWREKGGLADLRKARHYLDKYIELATLDKRRELADTGMLLPPLEPRLDSPDDMLRRDPTKLVLPPGADRDAALAVLDAHRAREARAAPLETKIMVAAPVDSVVHAERDRIRAKELELEVEGFFGNGEQLYKEFRGLRRSVRAPSAEAAFRALYGPDALMPGEEAGPAAADPTKQYVGQ